MLTLLICLNVAQYTPFYWQAGPSAFYTIPVLSVAFLIVTIVNTITIVGIIVMEFDKFECMDCFNRKPLVAKVEGFDGSYVQYKDERMLGY